MRVWVWMRARCLLLAASSCVLCAVVSSAVFVLFCLCLFVYYPRVLIMAADICVRQRVVCVVFVPIQIIRQLADDDSSVNDTFSYTPKTTLLSIYRKSTLFLLLPCFSKKFTNYSGVQTIRHQSQSEWGGDGDGWLCCHKQSNFQVLILCVRC